MKTLKRDKVVLNLREKLREQKGILGGQYVHLTGDKIYYQMENPKEIHYAIESDSGYRKPLYNNIIKKSLSAHNFSVSNANTSSKGLSHFVNVLKIGLSLYSVQLIPSGDLKT
tara:strand:- start:136 stop:474 length:339 start_codon:yes stop_codon:yes gene_type:complete